MNKVKYLLIMLIAIMMVPLTLKADLKEGHKSLNFTEALADEEIELANADYKETDDQAVIYLFRGKGCGYCRAFLTFLNSISEEYGKYFRVESFEVWNDSDNASMMEDIADFTGEAAGGVPYIIIGEEVFGGYASQYDERIKSAIMDMYNTPVEERYDVFVAYDNYDPNAGVKSNTTAVVLWNLFITLAGVIVVVANTNSKYNKLLEAMGKKNEK